MFTTTETPVSDLLHRRQMGVYYWFVPTSRKPWEKPHWVDVTADVKHLDNAKLDTLVTKNANLFYADQVPVDDATFDRFLKTSNRRAKRRERALAVYGKKRRMGPSWFHDAAVLSLVLVLGTLHFVS